MEWFEVEIIIYGVIIFYAATLILFGYLKIGFINHRGHTRATYSLFCLTSFVALTAGVNQNARDTLSEILKKQIEPTEATAKVAHEFPYGIKLKINDSKRTSYQFDLEDKELTKEFINKVNNGYKVSKMKGASELLLVNGNDSIYYNLFY
ncbi:MAG: hypothetical protein HDS88_04180 [Bacteroidales bacterium]|nr:hypothetical protein [Bacteroidales bacterium]MBD5246415.1 hypothetical protein [Barnesiella sp.]